jgi:hypothetical protein
MQNNKLVNKFYGNEFLVGKDTLTFSPNIHSITQDSSGMFIKTGYATLKWQFFKGADGTQRRITIDSIFQDLNGQKTINIKDGRSTRDNSKLEWIRCQAGTNLYKLAIENHSILMDEHKAIFNNVKQKEEEEIARKNKIAEEESKVEAEREKIRIEQYRREAPIREKRLQECIANIRIAEQKCMTSGDIDRCVSIASGGNIVPKNSGWGLISYDIAFTCKGL